MQVLIFLANLDFDKFQDMQHRGIGLPWCGFSFGFSQFCQNLGLIYWFLIIVVPMHVS